jgi:uncharacterized protein (TIGR02996 family)
MGDGDVALSDEEAFIRTLVAQPGDATPRLVYADWLDDRGDRRGGYLRAEFSWKTNPADDLEDQLREQAAGLDPVWVARVSRPPLGVCCETVRFADVSDRPRPQLSSADLDWLEARFGLRLPDDYRAFLLNYNGGRPDPQYFRHDLIEQRFGIALPTGYHGFHPDYKSRNEGLAYGLLGSFLSVWAAADTVPENAQASGDWNPDLVETLQLLEHWRSGVAD